MHHSMTAPGLFDETALDAGRAAGPSIDRQWQGRGWTGPSWAMALERPVLGIQEIVLNNRFKYLYVFVKKIRAITASSRLDSQHLAVLEGWFD